MITVKEIQNAIGQLPPKELSRLRKWVLEYDAQLWDEAVAADTKVEKLDSLAQNALREHKAGKSRTL